MWCRSVERAVLVLVVQAGKVLLHEYVLIHLSQPADKLQALLSMTAKLFALAAGLCAEDNADALSSHEALLPGSLLSKFMADKLAECLSIFKRQVRHQHYFFGGQVVSELQQVRCLL